MPRFGSEWLEEVGQRHAESGCKLTDRRNADVTLAAFDAADVVPMQVGTCGKFFLRNIQLSTQFADAPPDRSRQVDSHVLIVPA